MEERIEIVKEYIPSDEDIHMFYLTRKYSFLRQVDLISLVLTKKGLYCKYQQDGDKQILYKLLPTNISHQNSLTSIEQQKYKKWYDDIIEWSNLELDKL